MNRLKPWTTDFLGLENRFQLFEEKAVRSPSTVQATFCPQHYEPNYAYPLVVWLHADGSNEHELWDVMPAISTRNYLGVAPRGPSTSASIGNAYLWPQCDEAILHADFTVGECIETVCKRFNVASHRIFLAGSGAGGTMALRVAYLNPDRFAGVVSIGGQFPEGKSPLRNITSARRLPVWMAFRANQETVNATPIDAVCGNLRLLHSAGIHVMVRQYLSESDVAPKMLSDMNKWMMEIVTGQADSAETQHSMRSIDAN